MATMVLAYIMFRSCTRGLSTEGQSLLLVGNKYLRWCVPEGGEAMEPGHDAIPGILFESTPCPFSTAPEFHVYYVTDHWKFPGPVPQSSNRSGQIS
ncbi:hypothetical protein B0T17DRAFT_539215 [Bombardia bombarda]|uniref:Uncharacterized protein n=1 Tax=Bombardia bombarda TaxID=252184 RepID=A0AA39WI34_9PEZI|nr:hypothetical protein B0T17DRAFT_539215 [Bombardia bombarda]